MSSPRLPVLLSLLAFCVLSRVPSFRASFDPQVGWYLWNFSPLLALGLFSQAMYRHWGWATLAPLATYLLGDIAIWIASGDVTEAFHPASLWTYMALVGVLACGYWLRRGEKNWPRVGIAGFSGVLAFFLITNFGAWATDPLLPQPTGYDRSLLGLWQSYVAAWPFVRNDFSAMLLFCGLFFSPAGLTLLTRDAIPSAVGESAPLAGTAASRAEAVMKS